MISSVPETSHGPQQVDKKTEKEEKGAWVFFSDSYFHSFSFLFSSSEEENGMKRDAKGENPSFLPSLLLLSIANPLFRSNCPAPTDASTAGWPDAFGFGGVRRSWRCHSPRLPQFGSIFQSEKYHHDDQLGGQISRSSSGHGRGVVDLTNPSREPFGILHYAGRSPPRSAGRKPRAPPFHRGNSSTWNVVGVRCSLKGTLF